MRTFSKPSARRRGVLAILAGLMAALVISAPTLAGVGWCRADPVVRLNGTEVQVWVAIPEQYKSLVNGPIDVVVRTPAGVTREVAATSVPVEVFASSGGTDLMLATAVEDR